MLELGGQQPSNAMVAMNQVRYLNFQNYWPACKNVNLLQLTTGGQNLASVNRRRKKASGVPNPKRMFEEVDYS